MINTIIFSKDRAMQLRLLLESIKKNAEGIFNINVLYYSTTDDFDKGYQKLIDEKIVPIIDWHKQTDNFKEDVLGLLNTEQGYSCFFTDDDIVYRPIVVEDVVRTLDGDQEVFCFSLRLGENTTYCYTMNAENKLHGQIVDDNVIKWDWQKSYMDFGYPLSIDGHIFRTKEILKLTKKVAFSNPNTFEAGLQMFDNFPRPLMASYKTSVIVNTPINIVQNVFTDNRNSGASEVSAESLNQKYLDEETIDLNAIDFSEIKGCHQELELPIKKFSPLRIVR